MSLQEKQLNKNIPIPLYYQLKELLINEIRSGNYSVDSLLPTEAELGEMFGISRTTVRQAVTEMVQEGWVYRVKSKGTFVSTPKLEQDFISRLLPFDEEMKRLGKSPSTRILEQKVMKAPEHAAAILGIGKSEEVIYLHRLRMADGEPVVTVKTILPYKKCAFVLEHHLEKESLYGIMSRSEETKIYSITRQVEAVEANQEDVLHLQMKKGKPVQLFHSTGFNRFRVPLEYSVARYRADRSRFEVTVFTSDV